MDYSQNGPRNNCDWPFILLNMKGHSYDIDTLIKKQQIIIKKTII